MSAFTFLDAFLFAAALDCTDRCLTHAQRCAVDRFEQARLPWARQAQRYAAELAHLRARGLHVTAERVEAERDEWRASGG